jgi:hypothetical protein
VEKKIPFRPTDKEYLGSYQRAVSNVLDNMTKKELKNLENVAELWNKEGVPQNIQLKYVLRFFIF